MASVFGDRESHSVLVGNSLLRNFTGNKREASYQVVYRPGWIPNMLNKS